MTPTQKLARKVVETPRFPRWRVLSGDRFLASVPCSVAGQTEAEALAWARANFPQRADVRVVGAR